MVPARRTVTRAAPAGAGSLAGRGTGSRPCTGREERRWLSSAYTEALEVLSGHASVDLGRLLAAASGPAQDPVVYLADFARQVLLPLAAGVPAEPVTGTLAGRVFTTGEPAVSAAGDGPARVWVPVLEQTARIGVLAVALPDAEPAGSVRQAELLGVFAGLVVPG